MNEIVIVTTWQRNELLWLCLEAIQRANDFRIPVYVFADRDTYSEELSETCLDFAANLEMRLKHNFYGNSFNLIGACQWAVGEPYPPGRFLGPPPTEIDIVHLIEDDTLIHPDYLEWAREKLFPIRWPSDAMIGQMKNSSYGRYEGPDPEPHYAAVCGRIGSRHVTNWYESPCASWNAEYLRIALSHVVPEYFAETRTEMQRVLDTKIFPNSKYLRGGAEQDGFFLRCIEHHKWRTTFPPKPLATHFGHYGYNRPGTKAPEGTFEERIEWTRLLLKDERRRIELFGEDITRKEMEGERQ